tara:strand:- start:397 stop:681 length:285 start_codon:yes stop_codon:yes gene_type:complete
MLMRNDNLNYEVTKMNNKIIDGFNGPTVGLDGQTHKDRVSWIRKNCTEYVVKPNGDKHWLCMNWILSSFNNKFNSWTFSSNDYTKFYFDMHIER